MNGKKIRKLTIGGLLGAVIALCTAYVSFPIAGGYFHPGDAMVALSGIMLGPYAALPAAIGSCLADLLAGYTIYAPFTFVIKGLMGLIAGWGCGSDKVTARPAFMLLLGRRLFRHRLRTLFHGHGTCQPPLERAAGTGVHYRGRTFPGQRPQKLYG